MNAFTGNTQIIKQIYVGSTKVWSVYQGSSKAWALYKVNFKDWNNTVLKYEEVVHGNPASAPANPTREGYDFIGWNPPFNNITSHVDIIAQYEASVITQVNSVLVTDAKSQTIDAQNKSYGYMFWDGNDLPVWQTNYSLVFDNESYLGQGLKNASGTAKGYNGQYRSFTTGGRSGIALKSLSPKSDVLYTKVKLSPYCVVWVGNSAGGIINQWYYTDVSPQQYSMPGGSGNVTLGYSCYSRGSAFRVKMIVVDSAGSYTFHIDQSASSSLNGWSSSIPSPQTLTFDFTSTLASAGLKKGAKTTKVEFLEGTSTSSMIPAIVNAVCLYQDTLNT